MADALARVFDYHEATKHHFQRYARGPGYLDWATQPDPFRRYETARQVALEKTTPEEDVLYDEVLSGARITPRPLGLHALSRLLLNSLAISAWKRAGAEAWALRVNPSSGNLHPTEGYLVGGPIQGVHDKPAVYHYAPREHALERRVVLPEAVWAKLAGDPTAAQLLLGLASIPWREAWKYGERAYRYCQLDVGHALGAIAVAAAGLGWKAILQDDSGTEEIGRLLGLADSGGIEFEHADCLVAIFPGTSGPDPTGVLLDPGLIETSSQWNWEGSPNRLSRSHVHWEIIDDVVAACRKPSAATDDPRLMMPFDPPAEGPTRAVALNTIIQQRRSAVSMDGVRFMDRAPFFRLLQRLMPSSARPPFATLPWSPHVHLALFVHRVSDLARGLYFLCRNPGEETELRNAMADGFSWRKPAGCPEDLPFYLLIEGDLRRIAMQISCVQEIAGEGCFSAGMIARFEDPLERRGAWFYPRLYWECGMIGQVLYLEAEAAGLRGTGIGCYFDDPMHELLGLEGRAYQDLYHFTIGGPVEDPRLTTLPAYPELSSLK